MAKKATTDVKTELSGISQSLRAKYGDIIISGDFIQENRKPIISTGLLSLDMAFNGGVRQGTIWHIGGQAKSGKTTLVLTFAAQAQKFGCPVYFIDVEGRLQPELLSCIEGLDAAKLNIVRSSQERLLTAEDFLTIIESIIKDEPNAVIILDSIAALSTENELSSEMVSQSRAELPKLMYKFLRKIQQIVPSTNTILISITHLQANPTGYGSPFREVGGNAIQYGASYWMDCLSSSNVEDNTGKKVGKDSKFKIMAVANGPPDAEPIIPIRYGRGCDKYVDLVRIAVDLSIINKAGSWMSVTLDNLKDEEGNPTTIKVQGEDKMCQYLRENPNVYDLIAGLIRAMVFT